MSERERVIAVVAEVLECPVGDLNLKTRFVEDLGLSSLQVVEVLWRLESVFQLPETPSSKFQSVTTVGDLVKFVDKTLEGCKDDDEDAVLEENTYEQDDLVFDVVLASDHAGTLLKSQLSTYLRRNGFIIADLGPQTSAPVDYPDYASLVTSMIGDGKARFGVLVCGSGIGMSMAANRKPSIRAAVVSEPLSAKLARKHNNANIICFGARLIGQSLAEECLDTFLKTAFDPGDDGRHRRRIEMFDGVCCATTAEE